MRQPFAQEGSVDQEPSTENMAPYLSWQRVSSGYVKTARLVANGRPTGRIPQPPHASLWKSIAVRSIGSNGVNCVVYVVIYKRGVCYPCALTFGTHNPKVLAVLN
jgi:hypothetical protein